VSVSAADYAAILDIVGRADAAATSRDARAYVDLSAPRGAVPYCPFSGQGREEMSLADVTWHLECVRGGDDVEQGQAVVGEYVARGGFEVALGRSSGGCGSRARRRWRRSRRIVIGLERWVAGGHRLQPHHTFHGHGGTYELLSTACRLTSSSVMPGQLCAISELSDERLNYPIR
jgi:hypothetical protein